MSILPAFYSANAPARGSIVPWPMPARRRPISWFWVPPLTAAKPIVDLLVEVTDLQATQVRVAPVLEAQGYDYFWRPTHGDDGPPFYAWFIKRDPSTGARTHHIHMVEPQFVGHWDRLLFRDY